METKANYTLIGAFTLGIIAAGFAFVYWFSGSKTAQRTTYEIIFSGSVSGLSRGSQVLFNGLRVGEVTFIDVMENDPSRVDAQISVSTRAKITTDTRARLEFQGLTGVAAIALTGGSATADELKPGKDGAYPIIFAERSEFQNLLETVQRLTTKSESILEKADTLLGQNSPSLTQTVRNVETFSKALSDNSAGVNTFLSSMADVGRTLQPLSVKLEALSGDLDLLVRSVEPDKVRAALASVEKFTGALASNEGNIKSMLADAANAAKKLSDTSVKLDAVLTSANEVVKGIDPAKVTAAIDGVARVSASGAKVLDAVDPAKVRTMVDSASAFSVTLSKNEANINGLLADAAGAAKQLNAAGGKLDAVLAGAGDTLKALDAAKIRGAVDDLSKTAASAAKIAAGVDPEKVRNMIDSASAFADVLEKNQANINNLLADAAIAAKNLGASSGKLDGVLTGASDVIKGLDAAKIGGAVDNVSRFTATLEANRGNVDAMLHDASELAAKLNASADKIDAVLKGLNGFLGDANSRGMFTEIGDAAKSIRKLADNLDGRTKDIATGINRFTGAGYREYESLASDGRRTLNDLNRAVRSLERNPSQLIFGNKPAIPEYKGGQ